MDPRQTLLDAASHLRAGDSAQARAALNTYWAWRRGGGFEPAGGDKLARRLARLLRRQPLRPQPGEVFDGFPVEELRRLFATICDPADWRGPTRTVVRAGPDSARLLRKIRAAVAFMTATSIEIREIVENGHLTAYEVSSPGYRQGPAGDC
jgi:hypothetical protein